MISISPVNIAPLIAVRPEVNLPSATGDVGAIDTVAKSPLIVTLGQDTSVDTQTYSSRGLLPDSTPIFSLEKNQQDKITFAMMGNFSFSSSAGRFQGLGAALLAQLAEGGNDFSQSILAPSTGKKLNAVDLASQHADLHTKADNSITLTVQTASGRTVFLNLSSQKDGLAVQLQVTGGELDDAERIAVANLSDAFQSAIDGFTADPPKLDLGKLAQFDSTLLSSVDLKAQLTLREDKIQTLSFHADKQQRTVAMSGPSGNVQLAVDMKNSAILGNAKQQAQALQSYLSQFEAARRRGDGNSDLMTLFKDAFSALNSNYGSDPKQNSLETVSPAPLNDMDHGMLTGLADFTAALTQTAESINPMRPTELDKFSYQISQSTHTKGNDLLNRSVDQNQQSHLTASYHKSLYAGASLDLNSLMSSQNYTFHKVDDTASSSTSMSYVKGKLTTASLTQTATQSAQTLKYVRGHLENDSMAFREASRTQDFIGLLESSLQKDKQEKLGTGSSRLEETLSTIHSEIILQTDPAKLKNSEGPSIKII